MVLVTVPTEADFARLLASSRHNRNYKIPQVARALYLHHVQHHSRKQIAAELQVSTHRVKAMLDTALHKLEGSWPLFPQADVRKLHACNAIRAYIWPHTT